jgi:DNA-binding SARP family transcriptional activator/tetratricopeptide (TPR) repeat protein
MGLRLLGPLELVLDDRSYKIGGPRERVIVATLALKANRVTSVGHLVEAIWDDDPPPSARIQIQVCISGIRKLFRDAGQVGEIKTRSPGYLLDIPAGELDAEVFTSLVAEARTNVGSGLLPEAVMALRQALALWRGPALDGIRSPLVQRGAVLLEGARLAAIEECIRLELELGRHEDVHGELRALVDENPLSERLNCFLMLALYRAGRQVEALEVGRSTRAVLIDEVGIEPGPELRDLETRILNRDPALYLQPAKIGPVAPRADQEVIPPVTPRQLPGSTADFVGREGHVAAIKRLLAEENDHTAARSVCIVAISGRGGVGKTTLALRVAHELSDAFPDGHLYADLRGSSGAEDHTAWVLARFLRALGVSGAAMPDEVGDRAVLFRSLLANKRLLVVLDDVTTEQDVVPLLPGSSTCPVIVTSRRQLTGLTGAHWVHVDVFETVKSLELLAKVVGPERVGAEQDDAVELVNLCGGLPLALRIAAARLASRPRWRISGLVRRLADEASRLDEFTHHGLELRSSIALSYNGLSDHARRLFRLLAQVRALDFASWTAAALLDADLFSAEEVLDRLVEAQLLDTVEYPGGRVRYRMHALIRIYATELLNEAETDVERHDALVRMLGAWLAFTEKAHRAEYGGDYTVLHGTAPRWQLPDIADDDRASNAIEWWESERQALVVAVRQAAAADLDELCWDLALTSMNLFEVRGYFDDWQETTQLAYQTAVRARNRTGQAAMQYSLGCLHMLQKRLDEAERYFASALEIFESVANTHGCALVLRDAASVDRMRGNLKAMLVKAEEALTKMRSVGDVIGEATILRSIAKYLIDEGEIDRARPLLDEALAICRRTRHRRGEAQVLNRFAELHLRSGDIPQARHTLHKVLHIVRGIGDQIGEAHALYGLGLVRWREGRLANAETTLAHALSLAERAGERLVEGQVCYAIGGIGIERDDHSAAVRHLVRAEELFGNLGSALWHARTLLLLCEIHEGEGNAVLAAKELAQAASIAATVDSKESARLSHHVDEIKSALLSATPPSAARISDRTPIPSSGDF